MSSSKKIDLQRDFAAGVYLSEAQNPILPPPLYTVYVYTCILYTVYLFTLGSGGVGVGVFGSVKPEIREEGTFHKAGSKIPT
jgi:hypothetical protein